MPFGMRALISGLSVLFALAFPAGAAAGGPAHTSIGFEPIPLSVAADGAGHVYLSDPLISRSIQQYSSDGKLLANLGDFSASGNPFQPRYVTTDAAGTVYVYDGIGGKISVLGPGGETVRSWKATGGRDVAVGPDGTVYLATSHESLHFSADGALLGKWGASGGGDGQFGEVWGIDVSPSGLVNVADTYGNRVQVFTADGAFVTKWGSYGSGPGQFVYDYGIASNAAGEVYVVDTPNDRVQRFSAAGVLLGSWGKPGKAHGRFLTPTSIATDPAGFVYVADRAEPYPYESRARVQKFTGDGQFVTQWYDRPPLIAPGRPRLSATVRGRTAKRVATFRFHSHLKGVRYACRLSGAQVAPGLRSWRRCTSPQRYTHLRPGRKTFHVRAIKGTGVGPESKRSWLIVAGG